MTRAIGRRRQKEHTAMGRQAVEERDLSQERLRTENEIDNAIYALLCAAFGEGDSREIRQAVRVRVALQPTSAELIDGVCAELRERGLLRWEEQRRATACNVMAAFLDLPETEREDVSLAPPEWDLAA
ncbi:MAG: hypothetical protein JST92_00890 [Deltaproteobacteria bacterium]|nr:hypothetical protein [Deltaproteobacteria bacterium]